MTTVNAQTRYVVTETITREVTCSLDELAAALNTGVYDVMYAAARGRLTTSIPRTFPSTATEMFNKALPAVHVEYSVEGPIDSTHHYTVLDPEDPNHVGMPLAEGTLPQLDELLMPGTYQALRYGKGDPITLVVG